MGMIGIEAFSKWMDVAEPGESLVYFIGDITEASTKPGSQAAELNKLIDFVNAAKSRHFIKLRQIALEKRGHFEHIATRL